MRSIRACTVVVLGLAACRGGDGARQQHGKHADTSAASGLAAATGGMAMPGMTMSSSGTVRLTRDQIRRFGITFGEVERRTLERDTRAAGVVRVDETRLAQVSPKFAGYVEHLLVDFTGRHVRRGEPLMEIFSPELLAAQQELLVARDLQHTLGASAVPGVASGRADLVVAARRRLALWDVPDAQVEELLRTGTPRRTVTLFAPASGVVMEKRVVRGQAVAAGEALYTIADLSVVWIEAELRETDLAGVRVGTGADVELAALPGRTLKGTVAHLAPMLDSTSRTAHARVRVANAAGVLKPGMYATVRLHTPSHAAVTVPSAAVVRTGERAIVFVDMGGGELMPHEVRLGAAARDFTEVLSGVDAGMRVVTSAQFLLESESQIADVMRSMMSTTGSTDMPAMPGMAESKAMEGMDDMNAKGAVPKEKAPATRTRR